jgi:hypothetical protein
MFETKLELVISHLLPNYIQLLPLPLFASLLSLLLLAPSFSCVRVEPRAAEKNAQQSDQQCRTGHIGQVQ